MAVQAHFPILPRGGFRLRGGVAIATGGLVQRLGLLESLRGLLALWVVSGHVFVRTFVPKELGPLGMLAQPVLAVYVFIILSGFVIFYLLDQRKLSYGQFITQRFFRLVPLFLVALIVSCMVLGFQTEILQRLPWHSDALDNDIEIHQAAAAAFWPHFLVHAVTLQGLFDDVLRYSSYTLLGQGWSTSLEMQFSLVAPFLFALIAERRWSLLACVFAALCALRFIAFGDAGFLGNQTGWFAVGIGSYYLYKHADDVRIDGRAITAGLFAAIFVLYVFLAHPWPLIVWACVFAVLFAEKHKAFSAVTSVGAAILNHPVLRWVGTISYSMYLMHMLVFYAVAAVVLTMAPHIGKIPFLLIAWPSVIGGTIAVSALTYWLIEKPGIDLGKRLILRPRTQTVDAPALESLPAIFRENAHT